MKMTLFKTLRALLLKLGYLGVALAVHADAWTLANGDRLTGELIKEGAQFIELQYPQLGRLRLPCNSLRAVASARTKGQ